MQESNQVANVKILIRQGQATRTELGAQERERVLGIPGILCDDSGKQTPKLKGGNMSKGIYVAGKYFDDNVIDILYNMRQGIILASGLLQQGYTPFCPFIDFHFILSQQSDTRFKVEDFYRYSIHWLRKSDVLLCAFPGWEKSKETVAEIKEAKIMGIPIYYNMLDFYEQEKP